MTGQLTRMAAKFLTQLAGDLVTVRSTGSQPADHVNSSVLEAMREKGIDLSAEIPGILTADAVQISDLVITMVRSVAEMVAETGVGCQGCILFPSTDLPWWHD